MIRDGNRTEPEPKRTSVVPEPEQNSNLANSELGSGGECKAPDLCKINGEFWSKVDISLHDFNTL